MGHQVLRGRVDDRPRGARALLLLIAATVLAVVTPDASPGQAAPGSDPPRERPTPHRSNEILVSAPMTLDRPDTRYLLTADIVSEGTAFRIAASNMTLDLGGYTVTYGSSDRPDTCHAVRNVAWNARDVVVRGGRVVEATRPTSTSGSDDVRRASHAIDFTRPAEQVLVEDMTIEYRSPDTVGIYAYYCRDVEIRRCEILDEGDVVTNRNQLVCAVNVQGGRRAYVHDNRVLRCRQVGIAGSELAWIRNNAIHIGSVVANSYGILIFDVAGFRVVGNDITGVGVHPIGIGVVSGARGGFVARNRVEVENTVPGEEYGSTGSAGIRMIWGADDVEVIGNTFIVHARRDVLGEGIDSWGRAAWVGLPDPDARVTFRENTFLAGDAESRSKAAAVAIVGSNVSGGLVFEDNRLVSSWGGLLLGDRYGHADGYARFIRNRLERTGSDPSFRTIRGEYPGLPATAFLVSNEFAEGTSPDDVALDWRAVPDDGHEWYGVAKKELVYGWQATIVVETGGGSPVPRARVAVTDNAGEVVFEGTTDASGRLTADLPEYSLTSREDYPVPDAIAHDVNGHGANRIERLPFEMRATYAGFSGSAVVTEPGDSHLRILLE